MNNTIKKFIEFLNDFKFQIYQNSSVPSKISLPSHIYPVPYENLEELDIAIGFVTYLIDTLSIEKEEWPYCTELFYDFYNLSIILKQTPFNYQERLHIILYLIEKNIAIPFSQEKFTIDDNTTLSQLDEKIPTKPIENLNLSARQTNHINQVLEFAQCHRTIQLSYLSQKNDYQEDDIEKMISSFHKLYIDHELCKGFRIILMKNLEKRRKKELTPVQSIPTKKTYISTYKDLQNEIKKYYDEYHQSFPLPEAMDESQIWQTALNLVKIGANQMQIHAYYQAVETKLPQSYEKDPLTIFHKIMSKLQFYNQSKSFSRKFELQQLLEIIYFEAEQLNESFDTRSLWESELRNDLSKALNLTIGHYEYEWDQLLQSVEKETQKTKM